MKKISALSFLLVVLAFQLCFGQSKNDYLENNRFNLEAVKTFELPEHGFRIIGLAGYHGSAKIEEVEYKLVKPLVEQGKLSYYLPETDFSIAHFFNEYLVSGDTVLLKDLVSEYGIRVPQEGAIEVYEKWKKLKKMNDDLPPSKKLTVVGIDAIVRYKYVAKHILQLIETAPNKWNGLANVIKMVETDTTDFSPYYDSYSKKVFKNFVETYEADRNNLTKYISDVAMFDHIIQSLKFSFGNWDRELIIFQNYQLLNRIYSFNKKPQLFRFGFFHIEKDREDDYPSFFTRLIENSIYKRNEVISVMVYYTKSRVLWDTVYDDDGNYKSYTTEGGYGIGDYWKEYFKGIKKLKRASLSDATLFRLNEENSPYNSGGPDLMQIKMFLKKSNKKGIAGKPTTRFIDYAVLLSNSKANKPIEALKW